MGAPAEIITVSVVPGTVLPLQLLAVAQSELVPPNHVRCAAKEKV